MPDLDFKVESARAVPFAAVPTLALKLHIAQTTTPDEPPVAIHSVALRCQIRIEPVRRRYVSDEEERLGDLFGEPQRWGQTLRPMLWTHVNLNVGSFTEETQVDLPVECSYDFNLAATKYFDALEGGEVPLCLLFSGTIFYADPDLDDALQVAQISWEKQADFRLPIEIWKQMMEMYYPNTAWLCLRRDSFDRLHRFKRERGLPTWEGAIEALLESATDLSPTHAGAHSD